MSGHYIVRPCRCDLPNTGDEALGTIWRCDDCRATWWVCRTNTGQQWFRMDWFERFLYGVWA